MFNWIKKSKIKKEIKNNLSELKNMILDINITEDSSGKELEEFYTKVAVWAKVLEEKQIEFFTVMKELSLVDKNMLLNHINNCVQAYGAKMIKLNDALIAYLDEEKLSPSTKTEIALFGKNNVNKSNETLAVLRNLAKYIALSK